ncbi:MAG: thioredoxin domain-containing protein [Pseudomonadota bacterium]
MPTTPTTCSAADAPITIIEYASLTCPHCAEFNKEIMPELKAKYVETGKAKVIFRDYPLDQWAMRASVLARCAPADRYFGFLDVLFQTRSPGRPPRIRWPRSSASASWAGVERAVQCLHAGPRAAGRRARPEPGGPEGIRYPGHADHHRQRQVGREPAQLRGLRQDLETPRTTGLM